MAHYRLYCIRRGHFFYCEAFEALDDREAADKSQGLRGAHAAELWSGARKVLELPAPASNLNQTEG
ncbi:MAG TPA: hypothetical protein VGB62_09425 [Allosphingosinicella sp.]|jgi:hypothetical protein